MTALTASATKRVKCDIVTQLGIESSKYFATTLNCPNLKFSVKHKSSTTDATNEIGRILQVDRNVCAIVYCGTRDHTTKVAETLRSKYQLLAAEYHAGLSDAVRNDIHNSWQTEKVKVICATVAFGMGVDKVRLRFRKPFTANQNLKKKIIGQRALRNTSLHAMFNRRVLPTMWPCRSRRLQIGMCILLSVWRPEETPNFSRNEKSQEPRRRSHKCTVAKH